MSFKIGVATLDLRHQRDCSMHKRIQPNGSDNAHLRVTPPLVVAPLAHGEDMQWDLNDDGIIFKSLRAIFARAPL